MIKVKFQVLPDRKINFSHMMIVFASFRVFLHKRIDRPRPLNLPRAPEDLKKSFFCVFRVVAVTWTLFILLPPRAGG